MLRSFCNIGTSQLDNPWRLFCQLPAIPDLLDDEFDWDAEIWIASSTVSNWYTEQIKLTS